MNSIPQRSKGPRISSSASPRLTSMQTPQLSPQLSQKPPFSPSNIYHQIPTFFFFFFFFLILPWQKQQSSEHSISRELTNKKHNSKICTRSKNKQKRFTREEDSQAQFELSLSFRQSGAKKKKNRRWNLERPKQKQVVLCFELTLLLQRSQHR